MLKRKAKKPRTRPQLDAVSITAAALAIADREGLEGLSFRNLARAMDCEAMSLYHYFPSKAHLLDSMVELYLDEFRWPSETLSWAEQLRLISHEYRELALRHPGFYQFISIYRMNSASGLSFLNRVLAVFEGTSLSTELRARYFRVLGYYLTGAALDEALGYAKGPTSASPVPSAEAKLHYPAIISVGPFFSVDQHKVTFEFGLEIFIESVERMTAMAS